MAGKEEEPREYLYHLQRRANGKNAFFEKCKEEPLVPLGTLATTVVLIGGLASFSKGNSSIQQHKFMRARVIAQGLTVLAIAGSVAYSRWDEWFPSVETPKKA